MLRFKMLGSGSSGNSTVVEAHAESGTSRMLIDCGLSLRQIDLRLAEAGLSPDMIDAVFVTHEHSDHIGSAKQFALRGRKPLWMSEGTFDAIGRPDLDGLLSLASDTTPFNVGALTVHPFAVPHDAREPLQLICSFGTARLGVATDLGHATPHVLEHLGGCHALILECNHDVDLLAESRYPPFLKKRVGGRLGHLSNPQAAEIARQVVHADLHHVVAAHLSERNNTPQLALEALACALAWDKSRIVVAHASHGTQWLHIAPLTPKG
jgi:phosphoribosyl 1,2-cyclic phosphodiesterase